MIIVKTVVNIGCSATNSKHNFFEIKYACTHLCSNNKQKSPEGVQNQNVLTHKKTKWPTTKFKMAAVCHSQMSTLNFYSFQLQCTFFI